MLVGYARVSTSDQTLDLQHDALTRAGCTRIFTDTASGAQTEREGLTEALSYVRTGDTLVVWKLDRLGRSLKDLITRITELNDRKIGFNRLRKKALLARLREDFLCPKREERPMRGRDRQRGHLGGYVNPEARVPQDHPLRQIRPLVDAALTRLSPLFDELYSPGGP
jgi:hypothetical protein